MQKENKKYDMRGKPSLFSPYKTYQFQHIWQYTTYFYMKKDVKEKKNFLLFRFHVQNTS